MARKLDLGKEKNPAIQRIADMLVKAFNDIGEKIRADLLKAYRDYARDSFKAFMKAVVEGSGPLKKHPRTGREEWHDWHEYADLKKTDTYTHSTLRTWEDYKKISHLFVVSYVKADRDANEAYENSRDSFVHKNLDKLRNVLGGRTDLKNAVIRFDWRGNYFKGNVQIYLEDAYFRGDVDIKYVIRRIPRVTPYFQYPLLFVEADIKGKHYNSPSEDELRMLLGATKSAAEEKREAAVAAGVCPMSGQYVPEKIMAPVRGRMSPYVKCPQCGAVVSAQNNKFRQHVTPDTEKGIASKKLETAGYCPMSGQSAPFHLFEKLIRSYKTYPGGVEKTEYDFSIFGPDNKYRKLRCESCGQDVVINDVRGAYSPEKVRAIYRKHKLTK